MKDDVKKDVKDGVKWDVKYYVKNGVKKDVKDGVKNNVKNGVKKDVKDGVKNNVKNGVKNDVKSVVKSDDACFATAHPIVRRCAIVMTVPASNAPRWAAWRRFVLSQLHASWRTRSTNFSAAERFA